MITAAAALRDVEITSRVRRLAEADAQQAQAEQAAAIRAALDAGATVAEVAERANLSVERVYQIRRGIR